MATKLKNKEFKPMAGSNKSSPAKAKRQSSRKPEASFKKGTTDRKRKRTESGHAASPSKVLASDNKDPQPSAKKSRTREDLHEAKQIWEALRAMKDDKPNRSGKASSGQKVSVKQQKDEMVGKLYGMLKGRVYELCRRHDTSRMVEWLFKLGNEETKESAWAEIKPHIQELTQDKYGHFVIMELLANKKDRYASETVDHLCKVAAALMSNVFGADTLDYAYQVVANRHQKDVILADIMHGKQRELLAASLPKLSRMNNKSATSNEHGNHQNNQAQEIKAGPKPVFQFLLDLAGETFASTLREEACRVLLGYSNKPQILKYSVIHRALWEYLSTESDTKKQAEFVAPFEQNAPHLVHTKEGSSFVVRMILLSDAKSRKKIIKSFRSAVRKIAFDEYGHYAIVALLDSVDDTKLLWKSVLGELLYGDQTEKALTAAVKTDLLCELLCQKHGRLPILHLLVPRSTRYFHPQHWSHVWAEDIRVHSKKDAAIRRKELLVPFADYIHQSLFSGDEPGTDVIVNYESVPTIVSLLSSPYGSAVLTEYLLCQDIAEEYRQAAARAVRSVVMELLHFKSKSTYRKSVVAIDHEDTKANPVERLLMEKDDGVVLEAVTLRTLRILAARCQEFRSELEANLDDSLKSTIRRLQGDIILDNLSKTVE